MKDATLAGFALGVGFSILISLGFFVVFGDERDMVNMHVFGNKICSAHGLEYDHREINTALDRLPIIYCRPKQVAESESITDGVVILTFGGGR